ncbi:hypothetical protein BC940DRAFT_72495 [Gongronella butleri]|nr:hypothetical protein BC940DRAFT_72495 [Gongronella butleri]
MEAKVHEATNNEAWGASSTLMQEIAQGTYNYQYFNEIMPTLYKRFTEKEASQWRQIYKALVLLEYLVKNGSERVVDDARSHISMIKIMRNFHYIDEKGKDQGVNIRNRAKELADLLSDTEMIKAERKKAKKNRNKYIGVGSDTTFGMGAGGYSGGGSGGISSSGGGGRMGGFGSDSGPSSMAMGMGGATSFYDEDNFGSRGKYDDDDDDVANETSSSDDAAAAANMTRPTAATKKVTKAADLLDFDDAGKSSGGAHEATDDWGDFTTGNPGGDDFDDFQSAVPAHSNVATFATTTTTTTTQPPKKQAANLLDLLGDDTFGAPAAPVAPAATQTPPPPFMSAAPAQRPPANAPMASAPAAAPSSAPSSSNNTNNNNLPGGIWSQASSFVSLDSLGKSNQPAKTTAGPSMNAMKNSSVNAGWQSWATTPTPAAPQSQSQQPPAANNNKKTTLDDLLF